VRAAGVGARLLLLLLLLLLAAAAAAPSSNPPPPHHAQLLDVLWLVLLSVYQHLAGCICGEEPQAARGSPCWTYSTHMRCRQGNARRSTSTAKFPPAEHPPPPSPPPGGCPRVRLSGKQRPLPASKTPPPLATPTRQGRRNVIKIDSWGPPDEFGDGRDAQRIAASAVAFLRIQQSGAGVSGAERASTEQSAEWMLSCVAPLL
jgi:hypothetical protein